MCFGVIGLSEVVCNMTSEMRMKWMKAFNEKEDYPFNMPFMPLY